METDEDADEIFKAAGGCGPCLGTYMLHLTPYRDNSRLSATTTPYKGKCHNRTTCAIPKISRHKDM